MSVISAQLFRHGPYLKWSQLGVYNLYGCNQPAIDGWSVAAITNRSRLPCVRQLEPSSLWVADNAIVFWHEVNNADV